MPTSNLRLILSTQKKKKKKNAVVWTRKSINQPWSQNSNTKDLFPAAFLEKLFHEFAARYWFTWLRVGTRASSSWIWLSFGWQICSWYNRLSEDSVAPLTSSFEFDDAAATEICRSFKSILLNMRFAIALSIMLVSDSVAFFDSDLNMKFTFWSRGPVCWHSQDKETAEQLSKI